MELGFRLKLKTNIINYDLFQIYLFIYFVYIYIVLFIYKFIYFVICIVLDLCFLNRMVL